MHWKTTRAAVFLLLLVGGSSLWMYAAYSKWQKENSVAGVPVLLEISTEVLTVDEVAGFSEGCGVRVHRISDQSLQKLRASGLSFFESVRTGRDGGKYFRYSAWKATPPSKEDRLLRGLRCADPSSPMEGVLFKAIEHAAYSPGAYYAVGYEYDILVVPQLGIVVVSFSG
jgi:hypothetical protein